MSAIAAVVAAAAAKVGAELVGKAVGGMFGARGGELAETVVTSVAEKLGVVPESIPEVPQTKLEVAVVEVEAHMPETIALWAKGLDGQFALLAAETQAGAWQSGWRWGWMYLLAFFWCWRIIVGPALNALGWPVDLVDHAILLTLTTWFISLYMGGHTVKVLGESAIGAVKNWKGRS